MSEQQNNKKLDDVMSFLTSFRDSVEQKITATNEKLDGRMDELSNEIKDINARMTNFENEGNEANKRMDPQTQIKKLETEMKKSIEIRNRSNNLRQLDNTLRNTQTTPEIQPTGRVNVDGQANYYMTYLQEK